MIYLLTSSFKALPALNAGALEVGIFISSLVWGFLPFLALLFLTSKVPKPTNGRQNQKQSIDRLNISVSILEGLKQNNIIKIENLWKKSKKEFNSKSNSRKSK